VSPASGSVATIVPTTVSLGLFSATLNVWFSTTGGRFGGVKPILVMKASLWSAKDGWKAPKVVGKFVGEVWPAT
jgi:hypothetical protein